VNRGEEGVGTRKRRDSCKENEASVRCSPSIGGWMQRRRKGDEGGLRLLIKWLVIAGLSENLRGILRCEDCKIWCHCNVISDEVVTVLSIFDLQFALLRSTLNRCFNPSIVLSLRLLYFRFNLDFSRISRYRYADVTVMRERKTRERKKRCVIHTHSLLSFYRALPYQLHSFLLQYSSFDAPKRVLQPRVSKLILVVPECISVLNF